MTALVSSSSTCDFPATWRLDGRTCLITGATAGIGRQAAISLSRLGADLVLVGRSESRVSRIVRDVRQVAPDSCIRGVVADLSSQADVRRLAAQVLADVAHLHVLVNCAAIVTPKRRETVDGIEMQFAVNHLAPFLLTNLLLPRLLESAPARVVTVASQVERAGAIDFEDLNGRQAYDRWRAYRQSKLANILFTRELARRVGGRGITPVSLHPGVYTTRLLHDLMSLSRIVTLVRGRGSPDPELSATILARAAADPTLEGRAGLHLHEHDIVEPSAQAQDGELARRLWTVSEKLTMLSP